MNDNNQINPHALKALYEMGGPDFVAKMIRMFLDQYPGLLKDFQEGRQSGNEATMVRAVHTLKSSSSYVGGKGVSELAAKMEKSARSGDLPGATEMIGQLEEALETTKLALEQEIENWLKGEPDERTT